MYRYESLPEIDNLESYKQGHSFTSLLIACILTAFLAWSFYGCSGGGSSSPTSPVVQDTGTQEVTTMQWQAAVSDGTAGAVRGYDVYCASDPGYLATQMLDVGNVTSVTLQSIPAINSDGIWYCSVAPYDDHMQYDRQGEAPVTRRDGKFYK